MTHLRVLLHALDLTGPPILARGLLRWSAANRTTLALDVVSFRGGPLAGDVGELAPLTVVLDDHEAWDPDDIDVPRAAQLRQRLASLPNPDVTLLVSVAAGQCLPLLSKRTGVVVSWVVERGEDLHWLDPPVDVAGRTDRWLAGSYNTAAELRERFPDARSVAVAPEFIERSTVHSDQRDALRRELSPGDQLLFVGAGIGTWRKAPDLFLETALAYHRSGAPPARFLWVGGEHDPLIPRLRRWTEDLGFGDLVGWVDSTPSIDRYMAAADAFVHTARLDAFPLVCLHAAAAGTPVVSLDGGGGTAEMFGPEYRGARYPDVAGLASTLRDLATSGSLARVGAAQQRHVLSHFVSEVAASTVLDLALAERCDHEGVAR